MKVHHDGEQPRGLAPFPRKVRPSCHDNCSPGAAAAGVVEVIKAEEKDPGMKKRRERIIKQNRCY
jgi:hypothetical protein